MPSLEELHHEFAGNAFAIISVNVQEKKKTVQNFLRKNAASYTNVLDLDGEVSALYGVSSTPVKFLVDSKGDMVAAALGYREWDSDEMKSLVKALLDTE